MRIQGTSPKLRLVPRHDYAVYGHITMFRLIRDGGLIVSFIIVLIFGYMILYYKPWYMGGSGGSASLEGSPPDNPPNNPSFSADPVDISNGQFYQKMVSGNIQGDTTAIK